MGKALLVGINNYILCPLMGCVNDAASLSNLLERNADGSLNFETRLETNVPTKAKLREMLEELFASKEDTVLFYFAGHGAVNHYGGKILTPDFKKYDEGISMDEILNMVNLSPATNKIIILDCCHAGVFGALPVTGNAMAHLAEGVTILTACRDSEKAKEMNGQGLFTSLLLDALSGGAADLRGIITPGSVYAYVDRALGRWYQRPVFKTNVTSFNTLRTVLPQVAPEVLRKISKYFPTALHRYALDPSFEYTNGDIATAENIAIFKDLQKFESIGLIIPVEEEHMYWAAQNSKCCELTTVGRHYWKLAKEGRI
jgi:hypothetical protein